MADLEKQFDEAMMNVYRRAKAECNYTAGYFLRMLLDKRGVATAKQLLAVDDSQSGFTELYLLKRLDLTAECVVLDPKFKSLFDEEEIIRARKRLVDHDFDPAGCDCVGEG